METISATLSGIAPPFVSQSITQSAPASRAASSVFSAYSGLAL